MKGEKGLTLIEVVIALGILGIIAAAYLGGLANASKSLAVADERATAESLARSQMEHVKKQPYASTYSANTTAFPAGYSANITSQPMRTPGLQKIRITIYHNGKVIITAANCTVEGYKGQR